MGRVKELMFYTLVVLSTASRVNAYQTCYKLNGEETVSDFIPCNTYSGATSFCCGANRVNTSATYTNDKCMTNGLCQSIVEVDGVEQYNYYRESCSSSDWPTSECLRDVCTTPDENDDNGNALMTPCDNVVDYNATYSKTWCCGKNNTDCCGTDSAITLAVTLGGATSSTTATSSGSSSTATSSSTTLSSTTTTAAAAASSTSSSNSGLSTGASAGIGVGVAVGGLALIGAGIFWYVRRRRAGRSQTSIDDNNLMGGTESPDAAIKPPYQDYHAPPFGEQKTRDTEAWNRPLELDSHQMAEMDASTSKPGELPGNHI